MGHGGAPLVLIPPVSPGADRFVGLGGINVLWNGRARISHFTNGMLGVMNNQISFKKLLIDNVQ